MSTGLPNGCLCLGNIIWYTFYIGLTKDRLVAIRGLQCILSLALSREGAKAVDYILWKLHGYKPSLWEMGSKSQRFFSEIASLICFSYWTEMGAFSLLV